MPPVSQRWGPRSCAADVGDTRTRIILPLPASPRGTTGVCFPASPLQQRHTVPVAPSSTSKQHTVPVGVLPLPLDPALPGRGGKNTGNP